MVKLDRDGAAAGERLQGRANPSLGQDRRVDATCELPQLVLGIRQTLGHAGSG